jgi:plasmid stabilization system protein ParE
MNFEVRFSDEARADLRRLHAFLLDRAATVEDLDIADHAVDAIEAACREQLARTPFSFRKAGTNPLRRELIIPFGRAGYIALFQIEPPALVMVLAVRHQLEADYH